MLASTAGIPAGKRSPTIDALSDMMEPPELPVIAAGVVLRAPDGSVLFLKRAGAEANYAGHWGLPGGGLEEGETPEDCAMRECLEETGHAIDGGIHQVEEVTTGTGKGRFATFEGKVGERFAPKFKDGEHTDFVWAQPSKPPQPLHPGVAALMKKYEPTKGATDSARISLAFDRDSVRTRIEDGGSLWRLEVASAHISKATVNPYLGREIPQAEELGLEPEKVYQLLRHPDELAKAAPTANMLPLLRKHRPVSADDHQPYDVIGATGSSANFDGTYLNNALSIWTREGVEFVESGKQKELSCGYSYRAEMTPGNFDGTEFDGVMRDLCFNHLALVEDGRAGPEVVVGDSNQEIEMAENREIAKKLAALCARQVSVGAILTYLKPRMALDAKTPIMATIFGDVTGKKLAEQRHVIAARIRELAKGKLHKNKLGHDASLDDVEKVLEMLNEHDVGDADAGDESVSKEQHNAMEAAAHGNSNLGIPEKVGAEFADKDKGKVFDAKAFGDFLRGKGVGEDDIMSALDMVQPATEAVVSGSTDADPEIGEEEKKKAEAELAAAEAGKKAEDKKAMDERIRLAVDAASKAIRAGLIETQREIRAAEAEVRPYVGELPVTMSFDSAEAIRRHALVIRKVPGADKMHADALSAVLASLPKLGASDRQEHHHTAPLGMDADAVKDFSTRFPGSDRFRAA